MKNTGRPPAVIVGADINGLGVVRSLAAEGVPTYLVESDCRDPAMRTRYPIKIVVPSLAGREVIDALFRLRSRFSADPVLFLTRETSVEAVCAARDSIASCYRISMPDAELMGRLIDKAQFQALAEQHGFAIPQAVHVRETKGLILPEDLCYPCVLKPVVKTLAYVEGQFRKAYKVETPEQVRAVLDEIGDAAEMIAQQWIEGEDDQIYFCLQYRDRTERARVSFTGRKLRSWPVGTGGTASCVPAPEHGHELGRITDSFFTAVGFFGIGSMEFKRDTHTGRFMMIEPTVGRTDYQEEIATLNGVNIPYAAYCSELGLEVPPARRVTKPAAWAVSPIDRWSAEMQHRPKPDFPKGMRRYDALWRAGDPLPWCFQTARRAAARIAASAARRT